MEQKISPSLIFALIFLAAAGAVIYFLDMPQYQKMKINNQNIELLKDQLKRDENENQAIAAVVKNLEAANWTEAKKKIEPNFSSDPFYASKMEVFFRDIIGRSGMKLSSLSFAAPGSAESVNKNPPTGSNNSGQKVVSATTTASSVKTTAVSIAVTGTYDQLKALLAIMEKQAYLISVKSISFTGGSAVTDYSISADIYSY